MPKPSLADFTPAERRLIARLNTPEKVQAWLNALPYNTEKQGETLRSFREVAKRKTAHCSEAALFAACVLEQHGYEPLVMGLESVDYLDHVLFAYRRNGKWGTVARSRDPGLHGRKPVFKSPRELAMSYFDPYIDYTGNITGYSIVDLGGLGDFDWRFNRRNMWRVERFLTKQKHHAIKYSQKRVDALRRRYTDYREKHGRKPLYYSGRGAWLPLPREFR